jgi:hypothetical protein
MIPTPSFILLFFFVMKKLLFLLSFFALLGFTFAANTTTVSTDNKMANSERIPPVQ